MPRRNTFGRRLKVLRNKGKFIKCEAKPHPFMERPYSLESCHPAVVSCVVCGTGDNCHREATSNEVFCSSCLHSVDPATSWWGPIQRANESANLDNNIDTQRLGNVQVMQILMRNGSRSKPAKQARLASTHRVSIVYWQ